MSEFYYFAHSKVHGRCGHEHSSLVTLARCMLRREHPCCDDMPFVMEEFRSSTLRRPQIACLHQTMEVLEYHRWLMEARGEPLIQKEEGARVAKQIEMMEKAGDRRIRNRCPLCGAFARVTCTKACAYNRFHDRPVHVPQAWWDMHRRRP